MRLGPGAVLALYAAVGIGFAAGKLDLDLKLREALAGQQVRIAKLNAVALVDELENRKVGIPVVTK